MQPMAQDTLVMDSAEVKVTPSSAPLGAVVSGVDIRNLPERDLLRVRDAVLRHSVVVIRDQQLTPDDQSAFMDRLYGLRPSRGFPAHSVPGKPGMVVVSNILKDGRPIGMTDAGMLWHTDTCFTPNPEVFVSLYALEVPFKDDVALGDTRFMSATAAYEALSDDLKRELAGRRVRQSWEFHMNKMSRLGALTRPPLTAEEKATLPEPWHPVVRTHPITGRKLLYVNESFSERIEGLSEGLSQELLEQLWKHVADPRFQFRLSWRKRDLVVWDNCATQHLATFDYGAIPRLLHRCGTSGPVPE